MVRTATVQVKPFDAVERTRVPRVPNDSQCERHLTRRCRAPRRGVQFCRSYRDLLPPLRFRVPPFRFRPPPALRLRPPPLRGTLPPARRASLRPIAIACLRLVTFLPERPDLSVPRLRSC